ncbi:MAG: 30S ribosomal protein S20 [bacterium]|nr:30S ribosomal protein S20 [bacterium]
MAITKNAKKAHRASLRKKVFNDARKKKMKETIKKFKKLVAENKTEEAAKFLSVVYKMVDKTAKGNTIKKRNADRKKSRLSAMVGKRP